MIPVKFRLQLSDGAVVTRGLDQSLALYTKTAWQNIADQLSTLPMTDRASRGFQRLMLSGAMEVELDRQGRINLPAYLRDYAGIKTGVVVAGVGDKVELWSEAGWKAETLPWSEDPAQLADRFSELGI